MQKYFLTFLVGLFLSSTAWGQQIISGKVTTEETQEVLIGALVYEKNTNNSTTTDETGAFQLTVSNDSSTIIISYLGMTDKEIPLNGQSMIEATLAYEGENINEVVVTALGIERQEKALGYATQKVEGKELQQVRQENLLNSF